MSVISPYYHRNRKGESDYLKNDKEGNGRKKKGTPKQKEREVNGGKGKNKPAGGKNITLKELRQGAKKKA